MFLVPEDPERSGRRPLGSCHRTVTRRHADDSRPCRAHARVRCQWGWRLYSPASATCCVTFSWWRSLPTLSWRCSCRWPADTRGSATTRCPPCRTPWRRSTAGRTFCATSCCGCRPTTAPVPARWARSPPSRRSGSSRRTSSSGRTACSRCRWWRVWRSSGRFRCWRPAACRRSSPTTATSTACWRASPARWRRSWSSSRRCSTASTGSWARRCTLASRSGGTSTTRWRTRSSGATAWRAPRSSRSSSASSRAACTARAPKTCWSRRRNTRAVSNARAVSEYHAICPDRGVSAGRLDCRTRDLAARARCNFPSLVNPSIRPRPLRGVSLSRGGVRYRRCREGA